MVRGFRHYVGLLVLGLTLIGGVASAATPVPTPAPATNSHQALEISPPVIELAADPGQTVTANIKIRDVANTDLIVRGKADDFTAGGEDGNPKILLDETEATRFSLKFWVEAVPSLRLVPREIKTVTVKINVPKGAEPGGHYGVVRFTGTAPELDGQGVSLSASIGALILLRISGPISEKASLIDFYAGSGGKRAGLFERGPFTLTERVKNEGSVHIKPIGTVDVYDMFGRLVTVFPVNEPPRNILPDSIRKFEQPWNKKWLFGRYTARINLTYGNDKKVLSAGTAFWVIPYRLIALVLLILVILFFVLRQSIRNYNKRIIAKAKGRKR